MNSDQEKAEKFWITLNVKVKPRNLHSHKSACLSAIICAVLHPFGLNLSKHIQIFYFVDIIRLPTEDPSTCLFSFFLLMGKYLKEQIVYDAKLTYITNFICHSWAQIVHCY